MTKDKEPRRMNQGDIFELLKQKHIPFYMKQEDIVQVLQDIVPYSRMDAPRISRISNQQDPGCDDFSGKADEFFDAFFAEALRDKSPEYLDDLLYDLRVWVKERNLTFRDMGSKKYDTCEKWIRQMLKRALKNCTPANPKPKKSSSPQLRGQNFPSANLFIGRNTLLGRISDALTSGNVAVLRGMAGIGKSFVARQFAALHKEGYSRIQEVSADTDSPEDIMRRVILKLDFDGIRSGRKAEEQLFSAKMEAVRNLKRDSLVIIDGLDTFPKDINILREILRDSQLRVIITTRLTDFFSGMDSFSVPALDFGEQLELFERYYGRKTGVQDSMKTMRKILAYGDGNTMYIEQLARYIKTCEYTLDEALNYLHDDCCFPDPWFVMKDNTRYEDETFIGVFSKILFPREVSAARRRVLQALAMLPAEGISRRKVLEGFDGAMKNELRILESEGYAIFEQTAEQNITKIHPLVRSVIRAVFPVETADR